MCSTNIWQKQIGKVYLAVVQEDIQGDLSDSFSNPVFFDSHFFFFFKLKACIKLGVVTL